MTQDQHKAVRGFLERNGWQEYQTHSGEIWCRRYLGYPSCNCNNTKEGIQVTIEVHRFESNISYSVDVTGEKPDGVWVCVRAYGGSLSDNIITSLDTQVNQLLEAWALLAKPVASL